MNKKFTLTETPVDISPAEVLTSLHKVQRKMPNYCSTEYSLNGNIVLNWPLHHSIL